MRKLLFLILCFCYCTLHAQTQNELLFRQIQHYFNAQQPDSIYDMTNEGFQKHFKREVFTQLALTRLFPLGKIKSGELIQVKNGIAMYKIMLDSAQLEMWFTPDEHNKLSALLFRPYKEEQLKTSSVPSSNPMKTAIDERIDSIARTYIQNANTVGMSIGVLQHGKMTFYGYGETQKDNHRIPDENTIFEIGSITKTFTSTLLACFAEENKVSLSDPITKYLPQPIAENKSLQPITLLMLTNHTSGLPVLPDNLWQTATDSLNPYQNYHRKELFSWLETGKTDTTPGARYAYSNLAAGVLGTILERISDKTYEQLVQEYICKPLHMSSTTQKMGNNLRPRFTTVYSEQGQQTPAWDFDALAGAGALHSTAHDLLLYAQKELHPGDDLCGRAMVMTHKITYRKKMTVGMAWHQNNTADGPYLWHNGGTYGSRSFLAFMPSHDAAVVVLSNCGRSVDEIAQRILQAIVQQP